MQRTLFVGDVHGCADELSLLLKKARPTRIILVGDLFSKGPDPRGVWKLIKKHRCEAVLGNHDARVLGLWKPGQRLPRKAFVWLAGLPLFIRGDGWAAVHAGFDPKRGLDAVRPGQAMGMRETRRGVPWWQEYDGDELIVCGHHAREGLLDLRPKVLSLDTGCVSGGRLTGYLLEKDRIVSVPAGGRRRGQRSAA